MPKSSFLSRLFCCADPKERAQESELEAEMLLLRAKLAAAEESQRQMAVELSDANAKRSLLAQKIVQPPHFSCTFCAAPSSNRMLFYVSLTHRTITGPSEIFSEKVHADAILGRDSSSDHDVFYPFFTTGSLTSVSHIPQLVVPFGSVSVTFARPSFTT